MTCATATFPERISFDGRILSRGDARRVVGCVAVSLGTVAAVGVTAIFVAAAAAWIVVTSLSVYPNLHTRVSIGLDAAALTNPYRTLAAAGDLGGSARILTQSAAAFDLTREAEEQSATLAVSVPTSVALLAPQPIPEITQSVPPPPRRLDEAHSQGKQDTARLPAARPTPQFATLAPPPVAPTFQKPGPRQARPDGSAPPELDARTAVYDIEAHTVYLPSGAKLEAHSGLGDKLDNPRYVSVKDRGPTPPNVYDLTLREQIFHGVRAIRLNPVDERKTFGRDGMLAHTYMLGPSGQSFGCVSFKDYPAFLHAFLKGEVDRLVVVPNGGATVLRAALAGRGQVATLDVGR